MNSNSSLAHASPSQPLADASMSSLDQRIGSTGRLEQRLNIKDLQALQEVFMSEGDGYNNQLTVDKERFCQLMTLLLNKGEREEMEELFDKIDVTKDGYVDWDKFASHMMLECYEKDDKLRANQVPQWKETRLLPSPHRDVIQRVGFVKISSRYIVLSKDGCVSTWGSDFKLQRSLRVSVDSCRTKDLWTTHFALLTNVNKIAIAFTSKEIAIYDLSSKLEFNCQFKVQGLDFIALYLDYWHNPENPNEAILSWGDTGGNVNVLVFNSAGIALFERPPGPAGEKQEPCLTVDLNDVKKNKFKNARHLSYHAHSEWARKVKYCHQLECFISCASTWRDALAIGFLEKTVSRVQSYMGAITEKKMNNLATFQISRGISSFDFHEKLNLIATGGLNHHVCLWNPYVVSKPAGILRGHVQDVVEIQFMQHRSQLVSFSADKIMRIWDVQLQICIQRLAGVFPKGPESHFVLYFDELRNRLFVSLNSKLVVMEMRAEVKNRVLTADKSIVQAKYNKAFNQVVTLSSDGVVTMWMLETGQKVKQFTSLHGSAEVTSLAFDEKETHFYTGSTDGTLKVWDMNGHCHHQFITAGGQPTDVGQILVLKRSVMVIGWNKHPTLFHDESINRFEVEPTPLKGAQRHLDDILCLGLSPPNMVASGSYDGEIIIWNMATEQPVKALSERSRSAVAVKREASAKSAKSHSRPPTDGGYDSHSEPPSRARSRMRVFSRVSEGSHDEQNDLGFAIMTLFFLEGRRGQPAFQEGANLASCGGNGWVRMWSTSLCRLVGEFVAHPNAGSIVMATDKHNQVLVTGDVEGAIKVWNISDYCLTAGESICRTLPEMRCQYQPHVDIINSLELCECNDRTLIISGSADCSVALWDTDANYIGTFGQESHWKVERPRQADDAADVERPKEERAEEKQQAVGLQLAVAEEAWLPDEAFITDPKKRISTWDQTILGKGYQEMRTRKRERKQPTVIDDTSTLDQTGPFAMLSTPELDTVSSLKKPDSMISVIRPSRDDDDEDEIERRTRIPTLTESLIADGLRGAIDEKALFPRYILDYEMRMREKERELPTGAGAATLKPRASKEFTSPSRSTGTGAGSHRPTRRALSVKFAPDS